MKVIMLLWGFLTVLFASFPEMEPLNGTLKLIQIRVYRITWRVYQLNYKKELLLVYVLAPARGNFLSGHLSPPTITKKWVASWQWGVQQLLLLNSWWCVLFRQRRLKDNVLLQPAKGMVIPVLNIHLCKSNQVLKHLNLISGEGLFYWGM